MKNAARLRNLAWFAYVSWFALWFSAFVVFLASMVRDGSAFFVEQTKQLARADFVGYYETGKIALSKDRSRA